MPEQANPVTDWIDRNDRDWARWQTAENLAFWVEHYRLLARETSGDTRIIAQNKANTFAAEISRRRRPVRMPGRSIAERVQAVKDRFPLDVFCTQLLACKLERFGRNRYKSACPLPGHQDRSPSFVVYDDGHFHCFGCQQHGDIIDLTRMVLGIDEFPRILERLEHEAGIQVA